MIGADILVVGGGIAGLSVAAALACHGRVLVLERENITGYHSSGRSVTYYHFGIGNWPVRVLTKFSGSFFSNPPPEFSESPLATSAPAMMVVRDGQDLIFEKNLAEMAAITGTAHEIDLSEIRSRVPVLRVGREGVARGLLDPTAARLDGHALMMGYAKFLRTHGGRILTGTDIISTKYIAGQWQLRTPNESFSAPILINAAGAWADELARIAGVMPLGLKPLRRTVISFEAPLGIDVSDWPFVRSLADEFYFLPDSGHLLASPADETPSPPCDAQPDEFDVALAAWRIGEVTTMKVQRILHKWAGLRTFTANRIPTAGFAKDAPNFFWLAGQGGYGFQTAPAMSAAAKSLIVGERWPDLMGLTPDDLAPMQRNSMDIMLGASR